MLTYVIAASYDDAWGDLVENYQYSTGLAFILILPGSQLREEAKFDHFALNV